MESVATPLKRCAVASDTDNCTSRRSGVKVRRTPEDGAGGDVGRTVPLTNFRRVLEFHVAFGEKIATAPSPDVFKEDPQLVKLRLALIEEELQELRDALAASDLDAVVDALTDLLYVVYGAGVSFGVDLDLVFNIVCIEPTGFTLRDVTLAAGASLTERKVPITHTNFCHVLRRLHGLGDVKQSNRVPSLRREEEGLAETKIKDVESEVQKVRLAFADADLHAAITALANTLNVLYAAGAAFDVDLDGSFKIVHASNMSKLCETETLAQDTVEWYRKQLALGNGKYDSPSYKQANDGEHWVVYNESTGKVLKSIRWSPPDFRPLGVLPPGAAGADAA